MNNHNWLILSMCESENVFSVLCNATPNYWTFFPLWQPFGVVSSWWSPKWDNNECSKQSAVQDQSWLLTRQEYGNWPAAATTHALNLPPFNWGLTVGIIVGAVKLGVAKSRNLSNLGSFDRYVGQGSPPQIWGLNSPLWRRYDFLSFDPFFSMQIRIWLLDIFRKIKSIFLVV